MLEIIPKHIDPQHLWKGYLAELSCTLGIYLVEEPEAGLQSLLILCDYTDNLYTNLSIDRLKLTFMRSELESIIADDLLIPTIIEAYLIEEVETRSIYGLSLH